MDSFDRQPAPKPKDRPDPNHPPAFQRAFINRIERHWVSFNHPQHGRVAGYCEKASYAGLTQPGDIPDYTLSIVGRNPKVRNVIEVSLVESRAMFHKSEVEAVKEVFSCPPPEGYCPMCWKELKATPLGSKFPCSHTR